MPNLQEQFGFLTRLGSASETGKPAMEKRWEKEKRKRYPIPIACHNLYSKLVICFNALSAECAVFMGTRILDIVVLFTEYASFYHQ